MAADANLHASEAAAALLGAWRNWKHGREIMTTPVMKYVAVFAVGRPNPGRRPIARLRLPAGVIVATVLAAVVVGAWATATMFTTRTNVVKVEDSSSRGLTLGRGVNELPLLW